MMKITIFKTLALGLLSLALIGGPAFAGGPANCPAFNAAMVDAAALSAFNISTDQFALVATDDPAPGSIGCEVATPTTLEGDLASTWMGY